MANQPNQNGESGQRVAMHHGRSCKFTSKPAALSASRSEATNRPPENTLRPWGASHGTWPHTEMFDVSSPWKTVGKIKELRQMEGGGN